ncbi:MAG: mnmA [Rickettsiales bacterium]|jgi:tRNA-specific 2-thiouridylase|nr:mnmA [Rickettsiales bacterium]
MAVTSTTEFTPFTSLPSAKPKAETTIVVAMSGGVDSSTVAALLHDAGYKVIGITLQLYDYGVAVMKKGACCAGQDIYDARVVAERIGIPHYVLNYESIFKESVMDDFADSYMRGETPIPCVRCNQSVKFRDLFKVAKDLGADALATGHYVQRINGDSGPELHRGFDSGKDQSYFLFATTPEQLSYIHFPLGGLNKDQTRELARKYDLPVADKPDSQDICFVPDGSYATVIERLRPGALDKGEIVHLNGTVLGQHEGIIHYTIGQRRGLGIAWPEPLYVVKVDPENKQVIVGEKSALETKRFKIKDVNWLGAEGFLAGATGKEVRVKLRSAHPGVEATLYPMNDNTAEVEVHSPQLSVTPGQACVFYDGSRVLGGGWITRS